jgi:high-affinity iron transporter
VTDARQAVARREDLMLPAYVIGLREGVEAALIVGIVAAFLVGAGRRDALKPMWLGVALAAGICLLAGIGLHLVDESLPQLQQERFETVIALVAAAMVTYMVVWMRRNARGMRRLLEGQASGALARNSAWALVGMAFFAVAREGLETAVFLVAAFQQSTKPAYTGSGAVLGIVTAAILGWLIYKGGARINYSKFFRATGVVLVLVAAGLIAFAAHTAHEAQWLNTLQGQALDLSSVVEPGSVASALVTGMLGIQPTPTVAETFGWLIYAVPMVLFVLWPVGRRVRPLGGRAAAVSS